jgi:hypothetical protein
MGRKAKPRPQGNAFTDKVELSRVARLVPVDVPVSVSSSAGSSPAQGAAARCVEELLDRHSSMERQILSIRAVRTCAVPGDAYECFVASKFLLCLVTELPESPPLLRAAASAADQCHEYCTLAAREVGLSQVQRLVAVAGHREDSSGMSLEAFDAVGGFTGQAVNETTRASSSAAATPGGVVAVDETILTKFERLQPLLHVCRSLESGFREALLCDDHAGLEWVLNLLSAAAEEAAARERVASLDITTAEDAGGTSSWDAEKRVLALSEVLKACAVAGSLMTIVSDGIDWDRLARPDSFAEADVDEELRDLASELGLPSVKVRELMGGAAPSEGSSIPRALSRLASIAHSVMRLTDSCSAENVRLGLSRASGAIFLCSKAASAFVALTCSQWKRGRSLQDQAEFLSYLFASTPTDTAPGVVVLPPACASIPLMTAVVESHQIPLGALFVVLDRIGGSIADRIAIPHVLAVLFTPSLPLQLRIVSGFRILQTILTPESTLPVSVDNLLGERHMCDLHRLIEQAWGLTDRAVWSVAAQFSNTLLDMRRAQDPEAFDSFVVAELRRLVSDKRGLGTRQVSGPLAALLSHTDPYRACQECPGLLAEVFRHGKLAMKVSLVSISGLLAPLRSRLEQMQGLNGGYLVQSAWKRAPQPHLQLITAEPSSKSRKRRRARDTTLRDRILAECASRWFAPTDEMPPVVLDSSTGTVRFFGRAESLKWGEIAEECARLGTAFRPSWTDPSEREPLQVVSVSDVLIEVLEARAVGEWRRIVLPELAAALLDHDTTVREHSLREGLPALVQIDPGCVQGLIACLRAGSSPARARPLPKLRLPFGAPWTDVHDKMPSILRFDPLECSEEEARLMAMLSVVKTTVQLKEACTRPPLEEACIRPPLEEASVHPRHASVEASRPTLQERVSSWFRPQKEFSHAQDWEFCHAQDLSWCLSHLAPLFLVEPSSSWECDLVLSCLSHSSPLVRLAAVQALSHDQGSGTSAAPPLTVDGSNPRWAVEGAKALIDSTTRRVHTQLVADGLHPLSSFVLVTAFVVSPSAESGRVQQDLLSELDKWLARLEMLLARYRAMLQDELVMADAVRAEFARTAASRAAASTVTDSTPESFVCSVAEACVGHRVGLLQPNKSVERVELTREMVVRALAGPRGSLAWQVLRQLGSLLRVWIHIGLSRCAVVDCAKLVLPALERIVDATSAVVREGWELDARAHAMAKWCLGPPQRAAFPGEEPPGYRGTVSAVCTWVQRQAAELPCEADSASGSLLPLGWWDLEGLMPESSKPGIAAAIATLAVPAWPNALHGAWEPWSAPSSQAAVAFALGSTWVPLVHSARFILSRVADPSEDEVNDAELRHAMGLLRSQRKAEVSHGVCRLVHAVEAGRHLRCWEAEIASYRNEWRGLLHVALPPNPSGLFRSVLSQCAVAVWRCVCLNRALAFGGLATMRVPSLRSPELSTLVAAMLRETELFDCPCSAEWGGFGRAGRWCVQSELATQANGAISALAETIRSIKGTIPVTDEWRLLASDVGVTARWALALGGLGVGSDEGASETDSAAAATLSKGRVDVRATLVAKGDLGEKAWSIFGEEWKGEADQPWELSSNWLLRARSLLVDRAPEFLERACAPELGDTEADAVLVVVQTSWSVIAAASELIEALVGCLPVEMDKVVSIEASMLECVEISAADGRGSWLVDAADVASSLAALMGTMLRSRHIGAVFAAAASLERSVQSLLTERLQRGLDVREGSGVLVGRLLQLTVNVALEGSVRVVLRRSAGISSALVAVLRAVNASSKACTAAGTSMLLEDLTVSVGSALARGASGERFLFELDWCKDPHRSERGDEDAATAAKRRVHCMHSLTALFRSSDGLSQRALFAILPVSIAVASAGMQEREWGIRNAAALLFSALSQTVLSGTERANEQSFTATAPSKLAHQTFAATCSRVSGLLEAIQAGLCGDETNEALLPCLTLLSRHNHEKATPIEVHDVTTSSTFMEPYDATSSTFMEPYDATSSTFMEPDAWVDAALKRLFSSSGKATTGELESLTGRWVVHRHVMIRRMAAKALAALIPLNLSDAAVSLFLGLMRQEPRRWNALHGSLLGLAALVPRGISPPLRDALWRVCSDLVFHHFDKLPAMVLSSALNVGQLLHMERSWNELHSLVWAVGLSDRFPAFCTETSLSVSSIGLVLGSACCAGSERFCTETGRAMLRTALLGAEEMTQAVLLGMRVHLEGSARIEARVAQFVLHELCWLVAHRAACLEGLCGRRVAALLVLVVPECGAVGSEAGDLGAVLVKSCLREGCNGVQRACGLVASCQLLSARAESWDGLRKLLKANCAAPLDADRRLSACWACRFVPVEDAQLCRAVLLLDSDGEVREAARHSAGGVGSLSLAAQQAVADCPVLCERLVQTACVRLVDRSRRRAWEVSAGAGELTARSMFMEEVENDSVCECSLGIVAARRGTKAMRNKCLDAMEAALASLEGLCDWRAVSWWLQSEQVLAPLGLVVGYLVGSERCDRGREVFHKLSSRYRAKEWMAPLGPMVTALSNE